jgi:hypothetical protein
MGTFGVLLLIYLIWLSFGPRDVVLNQIRARKLIPIALIFVLYLLSALTSTAQRAAIDAELLMMGESAASIGVVFTLSPGAPVTLPATELILVTARNGNYYVVARQGSPPSARPVAYVIPSTSVAMAQMQRVNAADVAFADLLDEAAPSPVAP